MGKSRFEKWTNFDRAVQGMMSRRGRIKAQRLTHKRFKPSKGEKYAIKYFKIKGISLKQMDKMSRKVWGNGYHPRKRKRRRK